MSASVRLQLAHGIDSPHRVVGLPWSGGPRWPSCLLHGRHIPGADIHET